MITVYYGRAKELVESIGFEHCLNHLEIRRKENVLRTGDTTSQVRSLATGEILHLAVCRYFMQTGGGTILSDQRSLCEDTRVFETGINPGGKPYLKAYPEICFNLSHSGDYVCCAVGAEAVGVDIQKHVPVKSGLAERFFTEDENRQLKELSGKEREQLFFRMWSIKESYIKFTGQGMKQGIDTFEIDWKKGCIFDRPSNTPPESSEEMQCTNAGIAGAERKAEAYFEEYPVLTGYSLAVCRESLRTKIAWCNIEEIL